VAVVWYVARTVSLIVDEVFLRPGNALELKKTRLSCDGGD
jgi:hypothetical protein